LVQQAGQEGLPKALQRCRRGGTDVPDRGVFPTGGGAVCHGREPARL